MKPVILPVLAQILIGYPWKITALGTSQEWSGTGVDIPTNWFHAMPRGEVLGFSEKMRT